MWVPEGEDCVYLFILIGSDSDELSLGENISPKGAEWKLHYVVGSHNMKSGLVFVHGIQNCLEIFETKRGKQRSRNVPNHNTYMFSQYSQIRAYLRYYW